VVDCYAATEWVAANAERLGIDRAQISVGGDSAGGNLAAVVCLKARDEDGPRIALQVLVYPVTDLSSFATGSYEEFAEDHYLTRSLMEWFRGHYLSNMDDARNPQASPLLASDFRIYRRRSSSPLSAIRCVTKARRMRSGSNTRARGDVDALCGDDPSVLLHGGRDSASAGCDPAGGGGSGCGRRQNLTRIPPHAPSGAPGA
jgi:hypothetical protein